MPKHRSLKVKFVLLFAGVTVALLVGNIVWRGHILQEQAEHEMLQTTRVLADEMDAVWDFMEINQGQFVRRADGTYNLYCVVAAKAASRLFTVNNSDGFIIHYTNLTTRRPDDAPDAFETKAIQTIIADSSLEAYYSLELGADGSQVFRYVEPLYITNSCLECHGGPAGELDIMGYPKEGLREGDIAGVASIIMPADTYMRNVRYNLVQETAIFAATIVVALGIIFLLISRFVTSPMARRNTELQKEMRSQSDFLTIMSHEIRTPLTSILAFSDIWARTNAPRSPEEKSIMIEMRLNSQILLRMVNNILDMARVEAGRAELVLEPMELPDLLAAVRDSMGFLAERKHVRITISIARDVPVVLIDVEKVRRILENLITNAIRYVEDGGTVEVTVWYVFDTTELVLTVRDNGCGIKEEDQSYIFERFVQSHDQSKHQHGGSGLGLAVVKELAELHGGTVELLSRPGEGCLFTVRIAAANEGV